MLLILHNSNKTPLWQAILKPVGRGNGTDAGEPQACVLFQEQAKAGNEAVAGATAQSQERTTSEGFAQVPLMVGGHVDVTDTTWHYILQFT